jgi:hypothetical protein
MVATDGPGIILSFSYKLREGPIMRKISVIICTLVLIVLLFASNSFAIGLGLYIDLGTGSGEAEYDTSGADDFDIDTDFFGLGFQLETNPLTKNKVFSYRLQVGYESRDIEDDENMTLELDGLVINNTFAFGGNTSERVRIWGGPQVLVGFYDGETDEDLLGDEISFSGAGFGLGAAGGINFGLGSGKTILTTTIGVRVFAFAGESEWYDEEEDLDGSTTEFFFSVGILF